MPKDTREQKEGGAKSMSMLRNAVMAFKKPLKKTAATALSDQAIVTSGPIIGITEADSTSSKTGDVQATSLTNILNSGADLSVIVKDGFLRRSGSSRRLIRQSISGESIEDEDVEPEDDELFVSDYTRDWMRHDEAMERKLLSNKQIAVDSKFLQLPLPLPGKEKFTSSAPNEWVVQSASTLPAVSKPTTSDQSSCIRVFKREGTFATVICSIDIVTKDVCGLLAKKFFLTADVAVKYQLWLARYIKDPETMDIIHTETLVEPHAKPLEIQQQLLFEMGYDPDNDRFKEILREDNSYLYRWIFSETGSYARTFNSVNSQLQNQPDLGRYNFDHQYEKRLFDLIKLSNTDRNIAEVDLRALNLLSLPQAIWEHAESINSLKLGSNLNLELPQEFVEKCKNLTSLNLSGLQLNRYPAAISEISTLTHLNLSNNRITTIRNSNISKLTLLKSLNLQNNRLMTHSAIPIPEVSRLKNLEILNLSCNWIRGDLPYSIMLIGSELDDVPEFPVMGTFLNPLQELDLSYNMIRYLDPLFGNFVSNLRTFRIVSNLISRIPPSVYTYMVHLTTLDVRGNNIRGVAGISITSTISPAPASTAVEAVPVSSTGSALAPIYYPEEGDSNGLMMTKILLDNNHISDLRFSQKLQNLTTIVSHRNPGLLQISFSAMVQNLSTLILASSRLAFIPDDSFTYTPNLKVIVLNHNQLSALPVSITTLSKLIRLELANNSITRLPTSIKEWNSLEILDLRGNNLKDIPSEIWETRIRFLNLSSNVIEQWPDNPYLIMPNSTETSARVSLGLSSNYPSRKVIDTTILSGFSVVGENSTQSPTEYERRFELDSITSNATTGNNSLLAPFSSSLEWLSLADNRIDVHFFESAVSYMRCLRSLNVSHNELFSIPLGAMKNCAATLKELYLSGNHITQLPEDFHSLHGLKRLYLNNNRLGSIPPELGKLSNLRILDVGRNQLRYNVGNWPYDWNWNFNPNLRFLNLSGNPRLEIKSATATQGIRVPAKKSKADPANEAVEKTDIAKFDSLLKMRILGLMEVSVQIRVPDETKNRRVRVNAFGGASAHWKKQIGTDILNTDNKTLEPSSSNVAQSPNEMPLSVSPVISYGISDDLGFGEKSSCWDLVILGGKFFQNAREESRGSGEGDTTTVIRGLRKNKAGECVFGLFDGGVNGGNWCSKFLTDSFVARFSAELKKVVTERLSKRLKSNGAQDTEPELSDDISRKTDTSLIENALRRTFLKINKKLGDLSWKSDVWAQNDGDNKKERAKTFDALELDKRRKYGVNFETNIQGKLRKSRKSGDERPEQSRLSKADILTEPLPIKKEIDSLASQLPSPRIPRSSYWDSDSEDSDEEEESPEETYLRLQKFGHSGLIAYIINSQLFVANCGDVMAVISRNGVAVPVSTKHTLFSFQASASKARQGDGSAADQKDAFEVICARLEVVVFKLIDQFIHEVDDTEAESRPLAAESVRANYQLLWDSKNTAMTYVESLERIADRLERVASSLSTFWNSTIVSDIKSKPRSEQKDFAMMLKLLLEFTITNYSQ